MYIAVGEACALQSVTECSATRGPGVPQIPKIG